ncbi:uncharacterized protein SETTUDRAFT_81904, partial [Exserohilum turcica Et28A]
MYFSRTAIVSALAGLSCAQSMPPAPAASGMAGMVMMHVVQVGGPNGSLAFYPNNVQAEPGDMVQFQFHPKNHSVVQATFDKPCTPIQNVMPNMTTAFFSGFMPTNASFEAKKEVLTYTIRVTDKKPIWFYCSQAKHCQAGMVGAINAPTTGAKTMEAFIALAAKATENITPGQAPGSGGSTGTSPTNGGNSTGSSSGGSSGGSNGGSRGGSGGGAAGGASGTSSSTLPQSTSGAISTISAQSFVGIAAAAFA